ncbi:TrmB family transcriptional regulator [Haloarcula marina]|uniref:TrmB family transcriptional regulator n=1 Tax=Haloarcula marina TaxID=2961574 RepID=UPI0020B8CBE3|nr:TrmB family transcriptional regulator sugar-binding domain-containing protein [Halomicroarcula marina]
MVHDQKSLRNVLIDNFGLSTYEADVYLSLIRNGKQTMSEIAETSDVPRQRVYDITNTLRDENLIEIIDESPKQAYAVDPAETLGQTQSQIDSAVGELEEIHERDASIETGIAMFRNDATIEKYIRQVISSADVTVSVVLPFELVTKYKSELRNIGDEINSKLIVSNVPEDLLVGDSTALQSFQDIAREVRMVKTEEPIVVCADRSRAFFWVDYVGNPSTDSQGFYITTKQLALFLDRFIDELLWENAMPVYSRELPSLPLSFMRIRDSIAAIEDIVAEESMEVVFIVVDGVDTERREQVSFAGQLLDYYHSEDDDRAYLVLDPVEDDSKVNAGVVTVGGWNSTDEDYEATEITIVAATEDDDIDQID